jgi:hypothetical protein
MDSALPGPSAAQRLDSVAVRTKDLEPIGPASGFERLVEWHATTAATSTSDAISVAVAVNVVQFQDADIVHATASALPVAVVDHCFGADQNVLGAEVIAASLTLSSLAAVWDGA